MGQLGPVLILIRLGDEGDVRPIKLSVALCPVSEVAIPAQKIIAYVISLWPTGVVGIIWPAPRPPTLRPSHLNACIKMSSAHCRTCVC